MKSECLFGIPISIFIIIVAIDAIDFMEIIKAMPQDGPPKVLRTGAVWRNLRFYKKSETLYQLTFVFCKKYLPQYGDRTKDQMVQAARSGKQNIVEGSEDGKTSTEMELQLLNVARSSIDELREDFKDYIASHGLTLWTKTHPRYANMQKFTQKHNNIEDYSPFLNKLSAEEMANIGLTLCYQIDTMMNNYLKHLDTQFVTKGGIKERMYAARTGYRQQQDERLKYLEKHVKEQEITITQLKKDNSTLQEKCNELELRLSQLSKP